MRFRTHYRQKPLKFFYFSKYANRIVKCIQMFTIKTGFEVQVKNNVPVSISTVWHHHSVVSCTGCEWSALLQQHDQYWRLQLES